MLANRLDELNRSTYASPDVVAWYDRQNQLLDVERVLLDKLRPEIAGRRLLDIGVGGGRTTRFLLEISADYTGIDYCPQFVTMVAGRFGLSTLHHCDARDMRRFASASFDFALFSFNGLDYVDHEGRLKALGEIHRVLKPGGTLMFSTHNLDCAGLGKLPWQLEHRWTRTSLQDSLTALLLSGRRRRMRRLETRTEEYAILNDQAHRYTLLTYYISVPAQRRQLEAQGFGSTEAYDANGRKVVDGDRGNWVYFVTRKQPA
jgi:ubiquinone/menaquinone biosynthesis C-methylase UbiE